MRVEIKHRDLDTDARKVETVDLGPVSDVDEWHRRTHAEIEQRMPLAELRSQSPLAEMWLHPEGNEFLVVSCPDMPRVWSRGVRGQMSLA